VQRLALDARSHPQRLIVEEWDTASAVFDRATEIGRAHV
jgi:hypothetical protein